MSILAYIRLNNGDQLIGKLVNETISSVDVTEVIKMSLDPHHGFYAEDWLIFSAKKTVKLYKEGMVVFAEASADAIEFYNSYKKTIADRKNEIGLEVDEHDLIEEAKHFLN